MSQIKTILFDLDGTLRDTKDSIVDAYRHAVRVHTGKDLRYEDLRPYIHHHSAVFEAFSLDVAYEDWLVTYRDRLGSAWRDAPFFEDAETILRQLSMAGYRLGVVTSADHDRTIEYLSHRNIDQYFEVVVAMRKGFRPKPEPDMMLDALRQFDCTAEEAITIGDMVTDAQAAQTAGITFVGVTHGFADRDELEKAGADCIIDTLAAFPAIVASH